MCNSLRPTGILANLCGGHGLRSIALQVLRCMGSTITGIALTLASCVALQVLWPLHSTITSMAKPPPLHCMALTLGRLQVFA